MKKLLTFALCMSAVCSMSAQIETVKAAKKLVGKADKVEEARSLIKQAMADPATAKDVNTYIVAGDIEYKLFDDQYLRQVVNPNDPKVNPVEMAEELVNAYNYYLQALPYDSLPNAKGEVKPKHSKGLLNKIADRHYNFYLGGAALYDAKKYYPQAYEAFMAYGDISTDPRYPSKVNLADTVRATSYWYAGLSAWSDKQLEAAAKAFKKARLSNYNGQDPYIYEIAAWQNLMESDSSYNVAGRRAISEAAEAGYKKYGTSQPLFINNMINYEVADGDFNGALTKLNALIADEPENANLYGLRGYVNDRAGNIPEAEKDFIKAASLPTAEFETLSQAAAKLFYYGQLKWNEIDYTNPELRNAIKDSYWLPAKEIALKADKLKPGDSNLQHVIDNIDYALETYFK